jgi:hypothetical protein
MINWTQLAKPVTRSSIGRCQCCMMQTRLADGLLFFVLWWLQRTVACGGGGFGSLG